MPKPHPADAADRAKIATAASFNVHLRRGPHDKENREAPTLIEAIRISDRIAGETGGRAPMIYAITAEGASVFVPPDIIKEVRLANADAALPLVTALKPPRQSRKAKAAAADPAPEQVAADAAPAAPADEIPDFVPTFLRKDRPAIEAPAGTAEAAAGGDPDPKAPTARAAAGKRAGALLAAQAGELPTAPDFSAETHKRFRKKLADVVALAEAGDLDGLRAFAIKPVSSSPKAIAKYRDLAITALEARAPQMEPA